MAACLRFFFSFGCSCEQGFGIPEGLRRLGHPDADGVQRRRAFPRAVDRLQARRRARPPQDYAVQGIALHPCSIRFSRHELAAELPFLRQVYADGSSALPDWEREASIRQFYGN